jgi:Domain of unknown function (DUF3482)/50S ribosome-binding GTPase
MNRIPAIPTFAFVGQPNEGKTTVMATLAEDDRAAIGPVPGTTRTSRDYPVVVGGETIAVFYDTPGFEQAAATLEWFRRHAESPTALSDALAEFESREGFHAEREIFRPLAEGAAALYVADASRPVREVDRQEIEILRLAGVRRIGVLNSKESDDRYRDEWRRVMARDFNHVHEFNGHTASFRDRMRLLEAARAVLPEWGAAMDRCVRVLREDWENRLREVSAAFVGELKELMALRKRATLADSDADPAATTTARETLMDAVRHREKDLRRRLRGVFRHSGEHWELGELLEGDLFSEEVWRLLGLKRWQLAAAGALVGAILGGLVDAHTAFTSLGVAAMLGSVAGGVTAWLSAGRAVDVNIPGLRLGGLRLPGGRLGGRQVEASISAQSNLPWIVLDRAWLYVDLCTRWAHGKREDALAKVDGKHGAMSEWSRDEREVIARLLGLARKPGADPDKLEHASRTARDLFLAKLRDATTG